MEVKKHRCSRCVHCIWLNRWKCNLTCWQFEMFLPVECDEFEQNEEKPLCI